jgi:hypothetical protein
MVATIASTSAVTAMPAMTFLPMGKLLLSVLSQRRTFP